MARSLAKASSQYLRNASAVLTSYPIAMVAWYKVIDDDNERHVILSLNVNNATYHYRALRIGWWSTEDSVQATERAGSTVCTASSTISPAGGVWQHACGLFVSSTDRRVFLNGANKGTNTSDVGSVLTPTQTDIGAQAAALYFGGDLAELAIYDLSAWPGATDSDKADAFERMALPRLAARKSPLTIRRGLVAYWPLIRNDQDYFRRYDMMPTNGPGWERHPSGFLYPQDQPASHYTVGGIEYVDSPALRPELHLFPPRKWPGYTAAAGPTYTLTAEQGALSLAGQAAALLAARILAADAGALSLSGQNASTVASRLLSAAQGSLSFSGQSASLLASRLLTAAQGTLTLAGQSASLLAARKLSADAGALSLTGQDATLLVARLLEAAAGAISFTGLDATLTYTPIGGPTYTLTAETGTLSMSGQAAALLAARLLTGEAGVISLTGQDAALLRRFILSAETGAIGLSGQDAGLVLARLLRAESGALTLAGRPVTFVYSGIVTPESRIFVIVAEGRVYVVAAESRVYAINA